MFDLTTLQRIDDLQDDRQKLLDDKERLKANVENLEIELDEALQYKRYYKQKYEKYC